MAVVKPEERCAGVNRRTWHSYGCVRRGTLEHNGKTWCKIHHPPTVKAKDDARRATLDAEITAYRAKVDAEARNKAARDLSLTALATLAPELHAALTAYIEHGGELPKIPGGAE